MEEPHLFIAPGPARSPFTFEQFSSFEALYVAYLRARKTKRNKPGTAEFEARAIENLLIMLKEIQHGEFTPGELENFYIFEPKKRLIQAPTFRDKVVQRGLTDFVIYPELAKQFTRNTFAAQYGKGTHFALDVLEKQMRTYFLRRKAADEHARRSAGLPYRPIEEWDYTDGEIIKGDIRHFFASISHEKLKAALAPHFPDPRYRQLMGKYIDATDGIALGHQTSHIYAVFFVSDVMHYINEKLHLPMSGMYMDDWYIICPDRDTARKALELVRERLACKGLELNDKTNIFPLRHGIDFCGFHSYLTETGKVVRKLRRSSIKRMNKRIKKWAAEYAEEKISRAKIEECFGAWVAHAVHGDTNQLIRRMREKVDLIFKKEIQEYGTTVKQPGCGQPRQTK